MKVIHCPHCEKILDEKGEALYPQVRPTFHSPSFIRWLQTLALFMDCTIFLLSLSTFSTALYPSITGKLPR